MKRLKNKEYIFLSILREDADRKDIYKKIQKFSPDNWKALCAFAVKNEVFPVFYRNLLALGPISIPSEILLNFKNLYLLNLQRNLILQKELFNIIERFYQAGIPVIPLKGPFFAEYIYKDMALRQTSSDLDLLVKKESLKGAGDLLKALGYCIDEAKYNYSRRFSVEAQFHKKDPPFGIDLHWDIATNRIQSDALELWANAKDAEINGHLILAPSNEDLLLYMIFKAMFVKDFIKIKSIYDIHSMIKNHEKGIDWEVFKEKAKKLHFDAAAYFTFCLCRDLLGTRIDNNLQRFLKPAFLRRIFFNIWIRKANVLRSNKTSYVWYYIISVFLFSNSFHAALKVIYQGIFLPLDEFVRCYKDLPVQEARSLYMKRLLKPFAFFRKYNKTRKIP